MKSTITRLSKKRQVAGYLGGLAVATIAACGPMPESESSRELELNERAFTTTAPGIRPTINSLPASERRVLASAVVDFITQPILDEHANAHDWHHPDVGALFFVRHHEYLNKLESFLVSRGLNRFVPVPMWDPGSPIPTEFLVLDPLVTGALNANPNLPKPADLTNVCAFNSLDDLARRVEDWHNDVHGAVGGAMNGLASAPGAAIFWLWHGLLDDMYHTYEQCPGSGNDILWMNTQAHVFSVWQLDGPSVARSFGVAIPLPSGFFIQGRGDFNLDGSQDLLVWDAASGGAEVWFMKGINKTSSVRVGARPRPLKPVAAGDFDSNGVPDILWINTTTKSLSIWFLDHDGIFLRSADLAASSRPFSNTGDFDGDGRTDLLFGQNGTYEIWFMNGATAVASRTFDVGSAQDLVVGRLVGRPDSIGYHMLNGDVRLLTVNRTTTTNALAGTGVGQDWTLKGIGDPNRDGRGDLQWQRGDGAIGYWQQNNAGGFTGVGGLPSIPSPWFMVGTLTDRSF
jgi:hypothetical protein